MAEGTSPSTGITLRDLDRLLKSLGEAEREYLKRLVKEGTPTEAVRLVEIFHHFQNTVLVDE